MKTRLETADGALVTTGVLPPFSEPPRVLMWGARHFTFDRREVERHDTGEANEVMIYREAWAAALLDPEQQQPWNDTEQRRALRDLAAALGLAEGCSLTALVDRARAASDRANAAWTEREALHRADVHDAMEFRRRVLDHQREVLALATREVEAVQVGASALADLAALVAGALLVSPGGAGPTTPDGARHARATFARFGEPTHDDEEQKP